MTFLANGGSSSLLDRGLPHPSPQNLSAAQLQLDQLGETFARESSNLPNLLAMAGGGLAYRLAKSTLLSAGAFRAFAVVSALGAEVSAFRGANQLLARCRGEQNPESAFDAKGWLGTFVSFGALKGAGRLAEGQNPFMTHALQSSAMVAGNQLAYGLGLAHRPQGGLLEQFAEAETTNLAMIGGNALLGFATGHRLSHLERSLELRSQALEARQSFRRLVVDSELPTWAAEGGLPAFEGSGFQAKLTPVFERIRAGASHEQVGEALQAANIRLEDVLPYTDFGNPNYAKHHYARTLVHEDSQLQALVLGWRPGQHTCGHDHQSADGKPVSVAEVAIQGRAGEIVFDKSTEAWREISRRIQSEGEVISGAEGLYHLIFNAGDGNMITLHLYWPPLDLSRGTYFTADPWRIPIEISQRARHLEMPGPAAVSAWIRDLQARGVNDIVNLGMGQNGFPPEAHVREAAAHQALREPATYGAVQGQPALIEAIRTKYLRDHGVRYSEREVVVSSGGKSSLTLACQALFEKGETALILGPAWPSYKDEVALAGGKPVILLGNPEAGYRISAAELDAALEKNPGTKAIILTNPSNPTGVLYSRSELEGFAAIAERRNILVIADEIYDGHTYEGEFTAFSSLLRMRARTITMNGGSKVYSLAGWRVTWLVGPEELIQGVVRLQAHEAANTDILAQAALNAGLRGDQGFIRTQVAEFRRRAEAIVARLNGMGLPAAMPQAAFYAFANAENYLNTAAPDGREIRSDIDLARYLLDEAHVAVVPGTYFYAPGNFRLAFGGVEVPQIEVAMNRVEAALRRLEPLPPREEPPPPPAMPPEVPAVPPPARVVSSLESLRQALSPYAVPALAIASMWQGVSSGMALFAGLATALSVGNPYHEQTSKLTKPLLAAALVGLGAGMDLHQVLRAGVDGGLYTMAGIGITLGLGKLFSRVSGIERNQRRLIDGGTAICGGSAIAALTQALGLKAKDPAVSVAMGTVFTLNSLALYLFPWIGHRLNLSQHEFGLWSALAIHDTSSVVGAASQYGPEALQVAATVKLARALWIMPLVAGMNFWDRRSDAKAGRTGEGPKFPKFVYGFLAAAAANTFIPGAHPVGQVLHQHAQEVMRLTLFLIGANMNLQSLRKVGPRPFLHGTALWVTMGALSLLGIEEGWIR